MRKTLLTAAATAAMLSGGTIFSHVEAMTPAPSAVATAAAAATSVQQAAVVCGNSGCAPVQVGRVRKHRTHP
jgi:hypothetical protein